MCSAPSCGCSATWWRTRTDRGRRFRSACSTSAPPTATWCAPWARDASGTDFFIAATKLLLGEGLLLNGTLRFTRANQFGLLGHGGDREDGYRAQFEGSAALLLSRRFAVGGEFRTKPDNLRFARENDAFDLFGAWFVNQHLSVVLAYVDVGKIAAQGRQNGAYLSLQAGF
jgi:hypothetical protein